MRPACKESKISSFVDPFTNTSDSRRQREEDHSLRASLQQSGKTVSLCGSHQQTEDHSRGGSHKERGETHVSKGEMIIPISKQRKIIPLVHPHTKEGKIVLLVDPNNKEWKIVPLGNATWVRNTSTDYQTDWIKCTATTSEEKQCSTIAPKHL